MKKEELKPCPFCNDPMEFVDGTYGSKWIEHKNMLTKDCPIAEMQIWKAEDWNRRTP
jgi:hypothetical protein